MKERVAKPHLTAALLWSLAALAAPCASAQQQARADTLQGRVMERDSTAVPSARLTVVGEDGRIFQGRTDAAGGYQLVIPGGGGRYNLTLQAIGYTPLKTVLEADSGSHRIVRDLRLSRRMFHLDTVHVRPPPSGSGVRTGTPGESFETFRVLTTEILPFESGDLEGLASLAPGVLRLGAGGEELSLSIAGQAPDQNRVTVDGSSYGSARLPAEAMRSIATLTHVYDVSQGHFSGGQIAARTLSGTNRWGGGLSLRMQEPALGTRTALGASAPERRIFASMGGGGALVRDRLFVFGAADLARSTGDRPAFDVTRTEELQRLGVPADSARRFVEILGALGMPTGDATVASQQEQASALARLDYAPSDGTSFTFRLDGRTAHLSGLGVSPLRMAGAGNEQSSRDAGFFAQAASGRGNWSNELRLYHSSGSRSSRPEGIGPAGQVRVGSVLKGLPTSTYLSFGASPVAPPEERRSLWELSDDLVHESAGHRRKAGFLVSAERIRTKLSQNRGGTFTFQNLTDLRAGQPASFTRLLDGSATEPVRYSGSLYLGDIWAPTEPLTVVYGLRLDGSRYGGRSPLDDRIAALSPTFRRDVPVALHLSPRIGFTYEAGGPREVRIRGGLGAYQGTLPLRGLAALWNETGTEGIGATLTCLGPAAPTPDWDRYSRDPEAIPTRCPDEVSAFADRAPSVSGFAPQFAAPRSWRMSLGATGDLTRRVTFQAEAMLAHGQRLMGALDRNLDPNAAFPLPEEGGRPVYAQPDEIDRATGAAAPGSGRLIPELGKVLEINSQAESYSGQLTAGATGIVGKDALLGLSYTLGHAWERTGGVPTRGGPPASTAGDPREREWAPSSLDRRHSLQLILSDRLHSAVRIGVIAQFGSGLPFTPEVAGDLNADGMMNDRAFIFRPEAAPDTLLANGMRRLLEEAPGSVRSCLEQQSGRVAGRNSCRTSGALFLHVKAEIVPRSRRFTVTATASNVTAGLDYLLHGHGLRGWGQFAMPDPTLLEIRAFSPERTAYLYQVNPRFGRSVGGSTLFVPFQLTLQARLTVGADPRFQPMAERLAVSAVEGPDQLRRRLSEQIRNLPAVVLELDTNTPGELALTPAQVELLRAAAAAVAPALGSALSDLAGALSQRGTLSAARRARIEESAETAAETAEAGLRRVREILTAEQWAKLPAWLLRLEPAQELQRAPRFQTHRSEGRER